MGNEKVIASNQDSFFHGSQTVGTSAVQITSDDTPTKIGVLVKAASTNTGLIYVGKTGVTAVSDPEHDGFELGAGEAVTIEVDQAKKVYAIASAASQLVFWVTV